MEEMPRVVVVVPVYLQYSTRHFLLPQQEMNLNDHQPFLLQQQEKNLDRMGMGMAMAVRCTWRFPEYSILKLNTDGSSKGNPGPASFGGLIRDGKGRWLCGYMGKMYGRCYTSLEAELWSIFKGLCLIKDKKLSCMLIETDCQAALLLGAGQLDDHHPLKPVMDAINTMMMEQRCTMIHTRRDGNHCADQLAKLGGKQSEEYVMLEEPPTLLMPYLLRDTKAASELE